MFKKNTHTHTQQPDITYTIDFKHNLYTIEMANSINHTISNWIEFALALWFVFTTLWKGNTTHTSENKRFVINWMCFENKIYTHTEWNDIIHSYNHWFIHLIALYIVSHGDYYFIQSGTNLSKHFTDTNRALTYTHIVCHLNSVHPSIIYNIKFNFRESHTYTYSPK